MHARSLERARVQKMASGGQRRPGAEPAPAGVDMQFTINAQGRLQTPEEFGEIIIKTNENI